MPRSTYEEDEIRRKIMAMTRRDATEYFLQFRYAKKLEIDDLKKEINKLNLIIKSQEKKIKELSDGTKR